MMTVRVELTFQAVLRLYHTVRTRHRVRNNTGRWSVSIMAKLQKIVDIKIQYKKMGGRGLRNWNALITLSSVEYVWDHYSRSGRLVNMHHLYHLVKVFRFYHFYKMCRFTITRAKTGGTTPLDQSLPGRGNSPARWNVKSWKFGKNFKLPPSI